MQNPLVSLLIQYTSNRGLRLRLESADPRRLVCLDYPCYLEYSGFSGKFFWGVSSPAVSLRRLNLSHSYRSDEGRLIERFYQPCLSVATKYYRAVGYFTGQSLALAGQGLPAFVRRRGIMRLVAAPYLSPEDLDKIKSGYSMREVLGTAAL